MREIIYVTGNAEKFNIAREAFNNTNILLNQVKLDTPEIQSESVIEVAKYKAVWASNKLKKPVIVTNAGFYIDALNGFPGPFIKFINVWLTPKDFLNLMYDKDNRDIKILDCLAFCKPNDEPIVFTGLYLGKLSKVASNNKGTTIEKLFIPNGFKSPICDINDDDMLRYWSNGDILTKFKKYILNEN